MKPANKWEETALALTGIIVLATCGFVGVMFVIKIIKLLVEYW